MKFRRKPENLLFRLFAYNYFKNYSSLPIISLTPKLILLSNTTRVSRLRYLCKRVSLLFNEPTYSLFFYTTTNNSYYSDTLLCKK